MRVDVFRYVLMHDIGGLYCDLDYEFVRPFDYGDAQVVLSPRSTTRRMATTQSTTRSRTMCSRPCRSAVARSSTTCTVPPHAPNQSDVCSVTGPWWSDGLQASADYEGVKLLPKPVLSPRRVHGRRERKFYVNSGITHGLHGWGSWRIANWAYVKEKLMKRLGLGKSAQRKTISAR
jgi:hypothetical protein